MSDHVSDEEIKNFKLNIGKKVKSKREEKGFTQLELSLEIGYKSTTLLSKAEIGSQGKHFNLEQLYRIAKVLDCDVKDFLDFKLTAS
ncbi:MAG: helix-turn-helix transcriptional regulator [Campylobacterales bacterium]|nr:helix-turn-helix transcriptional regulator [Campylobacterales bacterium]